MLSIFKKQNYPVQGLWIGDKLSVFAQLSIQSYLKNGFAYYLYVYEQPKDIPAGTIVKDAREIVAEDLIFKYSNGSYAAFSNLFRFALLSQKGGIWSDSDIVCLKPFKFRKDYVFATEVLTDYKTTLTTPFFLQAKASSPAFKYALDQCLELRPKVISGEINWGIGNKVVTAMIKKYKLEKFEMSWQTFTTCNFNHIQSLIDPKFREFKVPTDLNMVSRKTVAIHLWNEIFRIRGIDVDQTFSANSLLEELKAKYL